MGFLILLAYATTAFTGPVHGGIFAYSTLVWGFGFGTLMDFIVPPTKNKPVKGPNWFYDAILLVYAVIHFDLLIYASGYVSHPSTRLFECIGMTLSVGLITGPIGLPIAHELIHRSKRWQRWIGRALLCSCWYGHFATSHVYQHHVWVGTPKDPVTARKGQSLYSFWIEGIPRVFAFAWNKDRKSTVACLMVSLAMTALLTTFWGLPGLLFMLGQSLVAVLLLEATNYVEHYGVTRKVLPSGQYEKIQPHHSWDSNRWFSGKVFVHLQRHADHHLHAAKPYQTLELNEKARQLPTGYIGMVLVALIPPLYYKIIDPKLEQDYAADTPVHVPPKQEGIDLV